MAGVVALQHRAGRRLLVVAATLESQEDLNGLIAAVDSTTVRVICLTVRPDLAARRIDEREPNDWPGKPWLLGQARRLAEVVPGLDGIDLRVSTEGRSADDAAAAIWADARDPLVGGYVSARTSRPCS